MKKFYFGLVAIFAALSFGLAHADSCQQNTVCVHPGDILQYDIHFGGANSTEAFYFLDMIDQNDIKVTEQFSLGPGQTQNTTIILNTKTGLGHLEQNGSQEVPFLTILPTPIQYNKTNFKITDEYLTFNGFKRTALSAIQGDANMTSTLEYDKDTGILLNANSLGITEIQGKPELIRYTSNLASTNMINSDSAGVTPQPSAKATIPGWIKNNAKFWSQGDINDDEFVKGIQYLIQQGIMKVPHGQSQATSTGKSIPGWIKNNAKFWSQGDINDDEFVKGIQYLMDSGIIRV